MFKKYADALWGVVILIVCALMFYATTQIRVFAAMEGLSSRFFPRVIIAIMAILGLFLIYFDLKRAKGYTQPEEDGRVAGICRAVGSDWIHPYHDCLSDCADDHSVQ